jgi:hypothetical protein
VTTNEAGGEWFWYCPAGRWARVRRLLHVGTLRRLRMFPLRLVGRHPDQFPETHWEIRREDGAWVIRPAGSWPFVDRAAPPAYATRDVPLDDREAATRWAFAVLPSPGPLHIIHDHQDGGPPEVSPD